MMTVSLVLVSMACGVGVAWIFRWTVDGDALRLARKHVYAHLLEFRLFADEPWLILRAQGALIVENLRICGLLLPAAVLCVIPLAWIFLQLEGVYGYQPLKIGQAAMVTVQMDGAIEPGDAQSSLEAPPGIAVETPPVRDFHDKQISWRIRALKPVGGRLKLNVRGNAIEKDVSAGDRTLFLTPRRSHSLVQFLLRPEEPRIASSGIVWVEIDYPKTDSWLVWFVVVSTSSALIFGRYA